MDNKPWDQNFDTCLAYYLDRQRITPGCATAWRLAKDAYDAAIETGDAESWIELRRAAIRLHEPTGDCTSDKIEWSFNRVSVMDDSQLQNADAEKYGELFSRQCAIELLKRHARQMGGFICSFRSEPKETECRESCWSNGRSCKACQEHCYRSGWDKKRVGLDNERRVREKLEQLSF